MSRHTLSYFESRNTAERYAGSRPYFHPLVIKKIKDFLQLRGPLPRAVDVACGTGQSTVALQEIASQVVGTDTSREMLARAPREAGVRYVEAPAEDLPFEDGVVRLDECREHGFRLVERESYANEVSFSVEELASYLMTQKTWLRSSRAELKAQKAFTHGW